MAKKNKKKIHFPFEIWCIFGLVIALTTITLAWLPRKVRNAKEVYYQNNLIISSLNLDIEFFVYNDSTNEYLSIAKYVDNKLVNGINYDVYSMKMEPGDRQSYRFAIKNLSSSSDVISDVSMKNLFTKAPENLQGTPGDILNKLSIFVSFPDVYEIPNVRTALIENATGTENEVLFYKNLTIKSNETVNLDWYVELSTTTGNEFWGYSFGFGSVYFSV